MHSLKHCGIFVLVTVFCFTIVANASSVEIQCKNSRPNWCTVDNVVHINEGDTLEFKSISNPEKLTQFDLHRPSTVSYVPTQILEKFPKLTELVLYELGIERLPNTHFAGVPLLKTVDLSKNKIAVIEKDAFSALENLVFLDLTHNQISEIQEGAFNGLQRLRYLFLNSNRLTAIKRGVFSGAPILTEVHLGANSIEIIEDGALDLPSLNKISVGVNNLKTLSANVFLGAPKIQDIDLSSNTLTHVGQSLEKLPTLQQLVLDNNPSLQDVNFAALIALPALTTLSLRNISLSLLDNIPNQSLNSNLEKLYLSSNKLSQTDLLNRLSPLKKLDNLELNNNQLTKLDNIEEIRNLLPTISEINLYKNKLNCQWLEKAQNVFKTQDIYVPDDVECAV